MNWLRIKYVIISPVRDEEKYIEQAIRSVLQQTMLPTEWVIVDDGSTDNTGTIIDRYANQYGWIRAVHRADRGFRKSGGGVVEAFYDGYTTVQNRDWDFIVKLDGDLSFGEHYLARCFEYFRQDPRLGIGGGAIYHDVHGKLVLEENPRFHVRGATKIYRKNCWEEIGGLWPEPGWDIIDEVKANMVGWKTYSFTDLHLLHQRFTGSAEGNWRGAVKGGRACYVSGYHPLFMLARCVRCLPRRPVLTKSLGLLYGFLCGYVNHIPQVSDKALIKYLRQQQLRRLWGAQTIWK